MKKLLLIAISIAFLGCNENTKEYAVIAGKITNKPVGDFTLNSYDSSLKEKLNVTADGSFSDTINPELKSYILYDGKNPIFLHVQPGFELNIAYDAQDFDNSLSITGKGSEISNYLIAKRKNEKELMGNNAETYMLGEADFKAKFEGIKKSQKALLNSFSGIPSNFIDSEKRDLHYFYLARINEYQMAHRYFSKNKDFEVSEDFLNELEVVDFLNEEDFKFSNNYKMLVTEHFNNKASELAKTESSEKDLAYLETVSEIENQNIKNGLLFDFANKSIGYSKDVAAFYEKFMENSSSETNKTVITKKYNKLTALVKGSPSPKFVNYENYAGGTTSLDDLKGKYVYIDVWATWCGPCKREIPFLQEIEKKYHGKNIEFVSLSIDKASDHEKWKAMVNDKSLGGTQLFADNAWSSSFVQDYQIQGIPRFILIDSEGKIVDSNAPRPSSPELTELFTSLNI